MPVWGLWVCVLVWSLPPSQPSCECIVLDTIRAGSYWSAPQPGGRPTEHAINFRVANPHARACLGAPHYATTPLSPGIHHCPQPLENRGEPVCTGYADPRCCFSVFGINSACLFEWNPTLAADRFSFSIWLFLLALTYRSRENLRCGFSWELLISFSGLSACDQYDCSGKLPFRFHRGLRRPNTSQKSRFGF